MPATLTSLKPAIVADRVGFGLSAFIGAGLLLACGIACLLALMPRTRTSEAWS